MNKKNEILENFAAYFIATNQTSEEASINMSDLECMSLKRLVKLSNLFGV
jgi:hypothetical protein